VQSHPPTSAAVHQLATRIVLQLLLLLLLVVVVLLLVVWVWMWLQQSLQLLLQVGGCHWQGGFFMFYMCRYQYHCVTGGRLFRPSLCSRLRL
jgi:uncharacterized membrane protein